MTGQDMRYLIRTGTCPQCKGSLSNREHRERLTQDIGDCESCRITWLSTLFGQDQGLWHGHHIRGPFEFQVEAYPLGEQLTRYA